MSMPSFIKYVLHLFAILYIKQYIFLKDMLCCLILMDLFLSSNIFPKSLHSQLAFRRRVNVILFIGPTLAKNYIGPTCNAISV